MTPALKHFDQMGKDLVLERGMLTLYALLEREDELGKWDLVISAPWVKGATIEDMEYVIGKMKKRLAAHERDAITHIILLRPDEPVVQTILRSSRPVASASGIVVKNIRRAYINGMLIKRGYILSANGYSSVMERSSSGQR